MSTFRAVETLLEVAEPGQAEEGVADDQPGRARRRPRAPARPSTTRLVLTLLALLGDGSRASCMKLLARLDSVASRNRPGGERHECQGTAPGDRPDPRALDDSPKLGALGSLLRGGKGYRVLTPTYPGFEVEVEALKADPSPIASLTVPEVVSHLAGVVTELEGAPHHGPLLRRDAHPASSSTTAAAPAPASPSASAPTEVSDLAAVAAQVALPDPQEPANRHKAVGFTPEEFHYAFANTLDEEESRKVYDRYHIPASGNWIFSYGLVASSRATRRRGSTTETPRAAPLHRRRRRPHHAPVGEQVEREALQVEHDHRVPRVPRPLPLDVRRASWKRSPTTPSTGRSSMPVFAT